MTKFSKSASVAAILLLMPLASYSQAVPSDPQIEAQVELLLSRMTLKDKVGQMCELAIDVVAQQSGDNNVASNKSTKSLAGGMISAEAVDKVFGEYRVGSILNVPTGVAQTPEVWADVIRTLNKASAFNCNGVPQIYGVDQIHGASYTLGATMFPQPIGQAASFNVRIPERVGQITAYESRACLIPWVYSPTMDLSRSPLWPRIWESYGEDVLMNSKMAASLTVGLQGGDPNHIGPYNVAACLKHYLAYGACVSGQDRTPSSVTYREMMEKYFPPFKECIEAGALSVMVNSSNNSGAPFHANRKLLTEWLKDGLDWDGMIVTDWADIDNLWKRDHVAKDKKDAIRMAINAGIDMTMDPYSTDFCTLLEELVDEGKVPMERIDDAVRRILRLKIRVGLMDSSTWDMSYKKTAAMYKDFGGDSFAEEAIEMAKECMVLLKNENKLLPLAKGSKIFVCGPNADNFRCMNGGWSYTWQGNKTDEIARSIGKYNTFLDALKKQFGEENVSFSEMVRYEGDDWQNDVVVPELLIEDGNRTSDKIARADVLIAFVGENSYTETPGNIKDLTLSHNQLEMVKALSRTGKPIILVLNEGRPRLITEIEPLVDAVVQTFLPGNYGGDALVQLLAGDANFSGRMPYTYPKYSGHFSTYDCKPCENVRAMEGAYNYAASTDVLYPFGYGLSYSKVSYSKLEVEVLDEGKLRFSVDVENETERSVDEPVLLFVSDLVASLTPDVQRLRAFEKVHLDAHEKKTVVMEIDINDLKFVDEELNWVLESGDFMAVIGDQFAGFTL